MVYTSAVNTWSRGSVNDCHKKKKNFTVALKPVLLVVIIIAVVVVVLALINKT